MSLVRQVRTSTGPVKNMYEKIVTEGDLGRFQSVIDGRKQILKSTQATSSDITPGGIAYDVFTLNFNYTPGLAQLMVGIVSSYWVEWILDYDTIDKSRIIAAGGSGAWDSADWDVVNPSPLKWFEESGIDTVTLYNPPAKPYFIVAYVPATMSPASHHQRVVVDDQYDSIAMEFAGKGNGIVMRTPSGGRRLLTLDDNDNLTVVPR